MHEIHPLRIYLIVWKNNLNRYEEFYNYDIAEAEPLASDEFETISYNGEKSEFYGSRGYEIKKIVEIFEEEVKNVEE